MAGELEDGAAAAVTREEGWSEPVSGAPERTVLHDEHLRLGAAMVDFHGWAMPLRYTTIPEEHTRVRTAAGAFDLCHMGRLHIAGPRAEEWLQRVVTNDVSRIGPGDARYTLITREDGGIIDDAIVYRIDGGFLLVVNASNRLKVVAWLGRHRPDEGAELADWTRSWAMIAVQGPESLAIATPLLASPSRPWDALRYYQILEAEHEGSRVLAARTGYTGEDGLEVYLPAELAVSFWRRLLEAGGERIGPTGLGARDTLRLEAGMPLYGNEIDETTNPYEAGLGFAVKLEKSPPCTGRAALERLRAEGPRRRLVGLRVEGRRVARQGMRILLGDEEVGRITSGAPSPTLGYPIAMGTIEARSLAELEAGGAEGELAVDLRGRRERLALARLPFVSRTRRKSKE